MKKEIKKKWLRALRSGKYKQGIGFLRIENKFCCLGVLCDLYSKDKKVAWKGERMCGSGYLLRDAVQKWAGLTSSDPTVLFKGQKKDLSQLNDARKKFSTIANIIEKQL